jgi:GR25 family glycosyltransferase involved in LPS biosynthesis
MILTDFFQKSFCINLDRRLDRWIKVSEEFKKYKFKNINRFPGIDGNNLKNNTTLLNGELGILQTHIELLKKCKEDNIQNILIFEDDVFFSPKIDKIQYYIQDIPQDWDMIYFGGNHTYGQPLELVKNNIYKLNFTVSLHCVALKNTIFDEVLSLLEKKEKQVDNYYTEIQKRFNCYGIYPNLAFQQKDYSDIQNKIVDYSVYFK